MNFRRRRHEVPGLNTTSTADISFMLLIFFLVTTSMDLEKGIVRQLPPADNQEEQVETDVEKGTLLSFRITGGDSLLLDGKPVSAAEATLRVEDFVGRLGKRHLISIDTSPEASYDSYFQLQNLLLRAYRRVRDRASERKYGRPYAELGSAERDSIKADWPQRVAEAYNGTQEGGGR
ncbi:biopolymer transporter ExbD [Prevotella sp. KH2C16]|uniref:ExbD/TolR family protein n=1 Tax=Prevotella sp. KH2C16 TaxID=1855325 RepID=UPI0008E40BD5|nr:biopolymer transporter ExbD [Prevotella sp. KH2C16]SFG32979.1 Biopolymer transport protein ExbD [Prevotella sp. KH2C16]